MTPLQLEFHWNKN